MCSSDRSSKRMNKERKDLSSKRGKQACQPNKPMKVFLALIYIITFDGNVEMENSFFYSMFSLASAQTSAVQSWLGIGQCSRLRGGPIEITGEGE